MSEMIANRAMELLPPRNSNNAYRSRKTLAFWIAFNSSLNASPQRDSYYGTRVAY
jgi:hypothetical protein